MTDPNGEGVCPNCDVAGEIGEPCAERACNLRGYHYIPLEYATWNKAKRPEATVGKFIGRYLAVKVLGAGGFGTVYLALQRRMLSKKAAVKLLHPQEDPLLLETLLRKFKAEAEAIAVVNHPNVVQLLEYGTQDDSPYMVMEFVEGGRTLKDEIHRRVLHGEGFTTAEVQSLLEQTANGLEAAHSKGIIHRDIKPENLMLQAVAGNPLLVRIVDFGLAKFTEQGTRTSNAMGTPTYMAPEQFHQQGLGPWTDLYAVGVVAFELLTGRLPFPGRSTQEVMVKKIDPAYDPLSQVNDLHLPGAVESFLRRVSARAPEDRYRNTAQFKAGLYQAYKALEETGAKVLCGVPSALLYPSGFTKTSRRNMSVVEEKPIRLAGRRRLRYLAGAVFALLIALIAVIATWTIRSAGVVAPAGVVALPAPATTAEVVPATVRSQDHRNSLVGANKSATEDSTWTDPHTGLVWQRISERDGMSWLAASAYCKANRAGLPGTGWHLPDVDELRSLITGCKKTAPGGTCAITAKCAMNCPWHCPGCIDYEGGGFGGCYISSSLERLGKGCQYWSSTEIQVDNPQPRAFIIDFSSAYILNDVVTSRDINVRCVR